MKNMRISRRLTFGFGIITGAVYIGIVAIIILVQMNKGIVSNASSYVSLQYYANHVVSNYTNCRINVRLNTESQNDETYQKIVGFLAETNSNLDKMQDYISKNKELADFGGKVSSLQKSTLPPYTQAVENANIAHRNLKRLNKEFYEDYIPNLQAHNTQSFYDQIMHLRLDAENLELDVAGKNRRADRIVTATDAILKSQSIMFLIAQTFSDISLAEKNADLMKQQLQEEIAALEEFYAGSKVVETQANIGLLIDAFKPFEAKIDELVTECKNAIKADADVISYGATVLSDLQGVTENLAESVMGATAKSISLSNTFMLIVIIIAALAVIITTILSVVLVRSVTKPLKVYATKMNSIVGSMESLSQGLKSGSIKLAENSSSQASSLQQTSASMAQASSMIVQNKENTRQASLLSADSEKAAVETLDDAKRLTEVMNNLNDSSIKINKITDMMKTIALQTNILALNASVEAARFGDAGKGFAVVAEEVRSLAQKSTEAVQNTEQIIGENLTFARQGVESAQTVSDSLYNISDSVKKVSSLISEIYTASDEQSKGVEQINSAITQIDQTAQSNAAISQETAASAGDLTNESDILSTATHEFEAMI